MSNTSLKSALVLPPKSYTPFYNHLSAKLIEEVGLTPQLLESEGVLTDSKLSVGNDRPPNRMADIYCRIASILRKTVENPCGVKTLARIYRKKGRRGVRPTRVYDAGRSFLRRSARLLKEKGLLASNEKGYYTTEEGKRMLLQAKSVAC